MAARAKQDGDAKRVQMMVRIAPQVRERLEEAARQSGRSLSQEVELSLAAHFAAADTRQIIREEIRAALGERRAPDPIRDLGTGYTAPISMCVGHGRDGGHQ